MAWNRQQAQEANEKCVTNAFYERLVFCVCSITNATPFYPIYNPTPPPVLHGNTQPRTVRNEELHIELGRT